MNRISILAACVVLCAACGGGDEGASNGDSTNNGASNNAATNNGTSNDAATNNGATNNDGTTNAAALSFEHDVAPIILANCNVGGCHAGAGQGNYKIGGDDSAAVALAIDGVASSTGNLLIAPNDLLNSEIYLRISGMARAQMPFGGQLAQADIDTIEAWIEEGAPFDN